MAAERVGEAVHVGYAAFFVVGVLVAFAVVELLHKLSRGVAEVEGDGLLTGVFDLLLDGGVGGIDGIRLGREGEIDDGFGEGEVAFGGAEELHCLLGGEAEIEGFGSGQADVFNGHADDAAGEVEGIFAGSEHAGEPIERGIGVAVADALVEGGDEVVMLFAGFVV